MYKPKPSDKCHKCGCNVHHSKWESHKSSYKCESTYRESLITDDELTKMYVIDKMSANEISQIFKTRGYPFEKTSAGSIIKLMRSRGFEMRDVKESCNQERKRVRFEKTCLEIFGTINPLSTGSPIKDKRDESVLKKYGVSNVFQLDSTIEKSKETCIEKYGVSSFTQTGLIQRNNGQTSKPHLIISNILNELGIDHRNEVSKMFKKDKYSPIVDILIESEKLVVEIYGDSYHANPNVYKDSDVILRWGGEKTAKEIREFDLKRKKQIESFGYRVVEIWTSDISKRKVNKENICEVLGLKVLQNSKEVLTDMI